MEEEAGDEALSPGETSPSSKIDREGDGHGSAATPGDAYAKRKLDVRATGETFGEVEEEDVPQTFERRRKKSRAGEQGVQREEHGEGASMDEENDEGNAMRTDDVDVAIDVTPGITNENENEDDDEEDNVEGGFRMMKDADLGPSIVGKEVVVYWPAKKYNAWYRAAVQRFDEKKRRMSVVYLGDGFKDTLDVKKLRGLIGKGWIKVGDAVVGGAATDKAVEVVLDVTSKAGAIASTSSKFAMAPEKAGCSKCRYKGCRECRGYTLAELRQFQAQQGNAAAAGGDNAQKKAKETKVAVATTTTTTTTTAKTTKMTTTKTMCGQGSAVGDADKLDSRSDGKHSGMLRPMRVSDFGPSLEGKELSVFWGRQFNKWYRATVKSFNKRSKKAKLYYPDDDWLDAVDLKKIQSLIKKDHIKIMADDTEEDLISQLSHHTNEDEELDLSQELSQEQGLRYMTKEDFGIELQGRTLSVFWGRGFNAWYRATVQRFDDKTKKAYLYYAADNHHETVDAKKFANMVSKARIKLVEDDDAALASSADADPSAIKEVVRLMTKEDLVRGLKGKNVVVFWTDDRYKGWYEANVRSFNKDERLMKLYYLKDKTSERIDPTLMYMPEGRIGFIEERPGNHQLVRGELDVALLDIKGRVTRPRTSGARDGDETTSRKPDACDLAVAEGERAPEDASEDEEDEEDDEDDSEEEEPRSPSQQNVITNVANGRVVTAAADDFGYDDYGGDDHRDRDPDGAPDAGNTAFAEPNAVVSNPPPAVSSHPIEVDDYIVDSYAASPNPLPPQPEPMPRQINLPAVSHQLEAHQGGEQQPLHQPLEQHGPPLPTHPAERQDVEASPSQPSVDPWENNRAARIFRWLSTSLAHPLSKQAQHAKLRPSLQEAVEFIRENVRDTIEKSFNNSILVVGAPGSGKTLAVSRVVGQVQAEWNSPTAGSTSSTSAATAEPRVGIVRLSGVEFSDERAAFREIARQLCETLNLEYIKTASLGDNIQFLLQILKALAQAGKAAVFILEEFDLFAHTQKQTFLYCLLDSLQKSQAKAVVIGTTCRHDCLDLLEKRVKSRFSHRSVTLTPPTILEDGDVEGSGAKSILTDILSLPTGEDIPSPFGNAGDLEDFGDVGRAYNDQVRLAMQDARVLNGLSRIIQSSNSLHTLTRIARKALAIWYAGCSAVVADDADDADDADGANEYVGEGRALMPFTAQHLVRAMDDVLASTSAGFESVISKLCPLDLSVLAAAYKARSTRTDGQLLNFEMIHHEFKAYTTSNNLHVDNYSRAAASKSFERLVDQGILRHPRNKGGSLSRRDRHYAPVLVQVTRTELQRGLDAHFNAPRQLKDWALRGQLHTTALNEYH